MASYDLTIARTLDRFRALGRQVTAAIRNDDTYLPSARKFLPLNGAPTSASWKLARSLMNQLWFLNVKHVRSRPWPMLVPGTSTCKTFPPCQSLRTLWEQPSPTKPQVSMRCLPLYSTNLRPSWPGFSTHYCWRSSCGEQSRSSLKEALLLSSTRKSASKTIAGFFSSPRWPRDCGRRVQFGSHWARTISAVFAKKQLNHGILFVDLANAFHRLVRETITGVALQQDFQAVLARLNITAQYFLTTESKNGCINILAQAGCPHSLLLLLRDIHADGAPWPIGSLSGPVGAPARGPRSQTWCFTFWWLRFRMPSPSTSTSLERGALSCSSLILSHPWLFGRMTLPSHLLLMTATPCFSSSMTSWYWSIRPFSSEDSTSTMTLPFISPQRTLADPSTNETDSDWSWGNSPSIGPCLQAPRRHFLLQPEVGRGGQNARWNRFHCLPTA